MVREQRLPCRRNETCRLRYLFYMRPHTLKRSPKILHIPYRNFHCRICGFLPRWRVLCVHVGISDWRSGKPFWSFSLSVLTWHLIVGTWHHSAASDRKTRPKGEEGWKGTHPSRKEVISTVSTKRHSCQRSSSASSFFCPPLAAYLHSWPPRRKWWPLIRHNPTAVTPFWYVTRVSSCENLVYCTTGINSRFCPSFSIFPLSPKFWELRLFTIRPVQVWMSAK